MWFCYHCTELRMTLLSSLHGSLPRFQGADTAPQWLAEHSRRLFTRWSWGTAHVCRQRLLHSIAGTTTKQIYLQSSGSKFKSFSTALISLNKQKSWFHLLGALSLMSVRPVFPSMNMKKLILYCAKPTPPPCLAVVIWRLQCAYCLNTWVDLAFYSAVCMYYK